ncbi:MAG: PLP-dependent aminotransferase family protein [Psychrobacter sp.]|nr:PLP-dependent aminotransferase family protein [Psychrobacter sp.]
MTHSYELNPNLTKTAAVAEWIGQRIEWHIYQPNQRVPSVRKLAKLLGISSFTVTQAYEQLVATGVLIAKPSSGYYVREPTAPIAIKAPNIAKQVIDTRWLVQQMFSDTPRARSPGAGMLPTDWVKNDKLGWALRQVIQQADDFVYDYGHIQGYLPLRQHLVQTLDTLGIHASLNNVMTTAGVSQAVIIVAKHLLAAGDTVMVDAPGWFWLSSSLQQLGLEVIGVNRDEQGPDIEQMQKLFERHRPKLYITNSVLHNPTSYNLHPARAHQVINLVHQYDAYILEDDCYGELDASGRALRYATLDQFERVFYTTGYAKVMAASWRVGLLVCPDDFIEPLLRLKTVTTMTTPEFGERVIHRLLTHGDYRRQVKKTQQHLYKAHQHLRAALPKIGIEYPKYTQAGMFIWVDTGRDTGELALDAHNAGWLIAPGQLFDPNAQASTHLRLNVGTTSDEFLAWLGGYLGHVD